MIINQYNINYFLGNHLFVLPHLPCCLFFYSLVILLWNNKLVLSKDTHRILHIIANLLFFYLYSYIITVFLAFWKFNCQNCVCKGLGCKSLFLFLSPNRLLIPHLTFRLVLSSQLNRMIFHVLSLG